jgi:ABC-type hemin transport system ATPase subunit
MLTRIQIKNFKKLSSVDIELGQAVVLIGPNNSGKTTTLQALSLWDVGLRQWNVKRGGKSPEKRPGVTLNRRDLIAIPVPVANLLWRDLHVRAGERDGEKTRTKNILIEIVVEGVSDGVSWVCGLEFDYANEESFYCRPLHLEETEHPLRMPVPLEASRVQVAYLPPMSGLAATEPKWEPGRINVLMGEGQTAQVLRNLCYQINTDSRSDNWRELVEHVRRLFGIVLDPPEYIKERGELTMKYRELGGPQLDLSSSGRGLQQTILLLAHLYANPGTILLLDEPDAHLEILRQRQTYLLLTEVARAQGSQIIAASHSEVVLNEAADRDVVIAFVGRPHRIDDRGSQAAKALKEIGFEDYYQAEQTGWVLYLEGATDLAILQAFARTLSHPAAELLSGAFVHYVLNQPRNVERHFFGLRDAKPDLVAFALFDRLERELPESFTISAHQWRRREIENYLCTTDVLLAYAGGEETFDLFTIAEREHRIAVMQSVIADLTQALARLRRTTPWSPDIKATDDFLDPLFEEYFQRLGLPNMMRKTDYHELAARIPLHEIDPEVVEVLDAIVSTRDRARPRSTD